MRTIKEVSFWGPRDEYIVTGCDSGRLCVYDRYTRDKVLFALADRAGPLNAVCRHPDPLVPMLLTYGLEDSAHVWAPVRLHSLLRFPIGRASVVDLTTGASQTHTYKNTPDADFNRAQAVGELPAGDEDSEFGRMSRTRWMPDPMAYELEAMRLAVELFDDDDADLTSTSGSAWSDTDHEDGDEEEEDEEEEEDGSDGEMDSHDVDNSHERRSWRDLHHTRSTPDTSDGEEGTDTTTTTSSSSSNDSSSKSDTALTSSSGSASSISTHSSSGGAPPPLDDT